MSKSSKEMVDDFLKRLDKLDRAKSQEERKDILDNMVDQELWERIAKRYGII